MIFCVIAMAFTTLAWIMDTSPNTRPGAWVDLNNLLAAMIGSLGLGLSFSAMMLAFAGRNASNKPDASSTWPLVLSLVALISPIPGIVYPMLKHSADSLPVLAMSLLAAIPLSGVGIGLAAWQSGASRIWTVGGLVFTLACIALYVFLIN